MKIKIKDQSLKKEEYITKVIMDSKDLLTSAGLDTDEVFKFINPTHKNGKPIEEKDLRVTKAEYDNIIQILITKGTIEVV